MEATPDSLEPQTVTLLWQEFLFSMLSYSKRALGEGHAQQSSASVYLGTKPLLELRYLANSCSTSLSTCNDNLGVCVGILHTAFHMTKLCEAQGNPHLRGPTSRIITQLLESEA